MKSKVSNVLQKNKNSKGIFNSLFLEHVNPRHFCSRTIEAELLFHMEDVPLK